VTLQERLARGGVRGAQHLDVVVACRPGVREVAAGLRQIGPMDLLADGVEAAPERRAPTLVPVRLAAGVAAAIARPAPDAVRAGPRGPLPRVREVEDDLVLRRLQVQVLRVVDEPEASARPLRGEEVRQAHVGKRLVVTVDLAIGRHVHEPLRAHPLPGGRQPVRKRPRVAEQVLEARRHRERTVVEEAVHPPPARGVEETAVGARRVDAPRGRFPAPLADPTETERLVRRQDEEADPLRGYELQRLRVDGGLGEPEAFAAPPETPFEVAQAPADLGLLVSPRSQRQDHVVVRLRDGVAVPTARRALPVRLEDPPVDPRIPFLEVDEKRRPEIEGEVGEVVHDRRDPSLRIEHAAAAVGAVALVGDPRVPVMERRRALLPLDLPRPGVLPRRLIEVPVNGDVHENPVRSSVVLPHCPSGRIPPGSAGGPPVSDGAGCGRSPAGGASWRLRRHSSQPGEIAPTAFPGSRRAVRDALTLFCGFFPARCAAGAVHGTHRRSPGLPCAGLTRPAAAIRIARMTIPVRRGLNHSAPGGSTPRSRRRDPPARRGRSLRCGLAPPKPPREAGAAGGGAAGGEQPQGTDCPVDGPEARAAEGARSRPPRCGRRP